jgi:hypothetical protein
MMRITRTVYTFTVLHPADEPPQDLCEAMARSYDGDCVGAVTNSRTEPVADVRTALVDLGNDGTFFDFSI